MAELAEVVIDARWLRGGMGTYALNLVRELRGINGSLGFHVLTGREHLEAFTPLCHRVTELSAPVFGWREQFQLPCAVSRRAVLHCTHYNAPLFRSGPLVVTIADVTPLLRPEFNVSLKSRLCGAPVLRAIARRADHIVTMSEYSRKRIVERLNVSTDKVTVAYNGIASAFREIDKAHAREICRTRLGIERSFLLYVGLIRPHKNVPGLLRAFAQVVESLQADFELLLVGHGTPASLSEIESLIVELGLSGRVHRVPVVDETTLIAAYNAAEVLVLPSFEEGFGLTVLEAMACGTPVACSAAASLPEVGGNAAAYFDPRDPAGMAAVISDVIDDPARQLEMRNLGLARAKMFTWAECARIHYSVYSHFVN